MVGAAPRSLLLVILSCAVFARADEHLLEASYVDRGMVSAATITMSGLAAPLHYLESGPKESHQLVIFLHGASFSARTWQIIGVLDAVGGAGFHAVALDLPGYGSGLSGRQRQSPTERRLLLPKFLDAIGWDLVRKVVVVAASMGGAYALPFVIAHPERVAGYVTAAALLDPEVVAGCSHEPCSTIPSLIVWGELDSPGGNKALVTESLFAAHQKVVYRNAPHPCYLKYPDVFTRHLLEFLGAGNGKGNGIADVDPSSRIDPGDGFKSDSRVVQGSMVRVHANW
mmetsp:Transcript_20548/g.62688  ORF Transcript_20548/g.62688 Transcript_20548/m.62688 type:complete len:284 (+) Transcript_20548:22-873(+)|eukprot:scaffold235721_cov33-Tisochrysis_lutea.AAC.1